MIRRMSKIARWTGFLIALSLFSSLFSSLGLAQESTAVPIGTSYEVEKSGIVSGVKVQAQPDGSVWFLVPALDRIAVLQGGVTKQWALRDDNHLGANPVDFEIDGDFVWFLCNGESEVEAGHSIFGRLDTVSGQVREWEIPGSRPAGFYRAPDGKLWVPQTNQRLQSIDLTTLEVVDYRSQLTSVYSDVVLGPDGALWMTDFGNNRIVRFEPGSASETSWTLVDPTFAILSPSQIQFDPQGFLWISEFTGARVDRFDPATGDVVSYIGFANPIHLDLFAGRAYVTEASGGNGRVALLDPRVAAFVTGTVPAQNSLVLRLVHSPSARVRDYTVTPTTFDSGPEPIPPDDLEVTSGSPGVLRTEIPWQNAYGIAVSKGEVWVGTAGHVVHLALQTIGTATDLVAPVATQLAGDANSESRVDILLHNSSDETIAGEILYIFSPGFFPARVGFSVAPGGTSFVPDAFGDIGTTTVPFSGPIRLHVTSGPPDQLVASVRTAQARADGGAFGYETPAFAQTEAVGEGETGTLFTGFRDQETSILGFFSPAGVEAVFTLVAADGSVRGTLPISLPANLTQEFEPAASAFGVAEQPGDMIRVSVLSGSIFPWVRIVDEGSKDSALSLPVRPTTTGVFPNVGNALGQFDTIFLSDLALSNPSTSPTEVRLSYFPLDPDEPNVTQTFTLGAEETRVFLFVLPTVFQVDPGQGTILVESDVSIFSSVRIAARKEEGDFATLAPPLELGQAVTTSGSAFAVHTATRRTNLILHNRGVEGTATVVLYNGNGDEIGRTAVRVGSFETARIDSLLPAVGIEQEPNGRVVVLSADGMSLYGWVAQVDGPTGDVEIEPLQP
jgi:streptogramin lyase